MFSYLLIPIYGQDTSENDFFKMQFKESASPERNLILAFENAA